MDSAVAPTKAEHRSNSLLTLPPELRNYIYALAVMEDEPNIAYIVEKPVRRRNTTDGKGEGRLDLKRTIHPTLPGILLRVVERTERRLRCSMARTHSCLVRGQASDPRCTDGRMK